MLRFARVLVAMALIAPWGPKAPMSVPVAVVVAPQRFVIQPVADGLVRIEGLYPQKAGLCEAKRAGPLRAIYRGRLTVERESDGRLRIINTLSFSDYLKGLAEVPTSWPREALRAQIIAARSYALRAYRSGRAGSGARGYDICSTDACQVYRGAAIELGAFGERWVAAVRETRGQILTYGGRVIQAFFFSTSTGTTRRSFPGGTPQPWLPSVSGEDADSPLARWKARVRFADIAPILRATGSPIGAVSSATRVGDQVRLRTATRTVTISARALRNALNNEARCLFPGRYPDPSGSASHGPLPQSVPSSTYTLASSGKDLVFSGRGWGHGVGMSQYGARSLASRGRTATQILKHFYGPARITRITEPGSLRVLAAAGLRSVRVLLDGDARITTETGSVLRASERFEVLGGARMRIRRGIGPAARPVLTVAIPTQTLTIDQGAPAQVSFDVSRPARVSLELRRGAQKILATEQTSFEKGPNTLAIPVRDDQGMALIAGSYQAVVIAYDGLDRVRSAPIAITVLGKEPVRHGRSVPLALIIGAIVGIAAASLAALIRLRGAALNRR